MNNYQWINTPEKPNEHACMLELHGTRLYLGRIHRTAEPLIPNTQSFGWHYNGRMHSSLAAAKAALIKRVEGNAHA